MKSAPAPEAYELLERGGLYADLYRLQFQGGRTLTDTARAETLENQPDAVHSRGLLRRLRARFFATDNA